MKLASRMRETLRGTALAASGAAAAETFCERARDPDALDAVGDDAFRGVARALAARPEAAGFLAHRPALLEQLAALRPESTEERCAALAAWSLPDDGQDLEGALDALRLLRRDETLLAACLLFNGWCTLPAFSSLLSQLAETITERSLELARRSAAPLDFCVIGMGKIGGREFTIESDLDLIFLHADGAARVDDASRVGQRLVTYLSTMTGAGIAYRVDSRLRPSGGQGMLVTSLAAFETYQRERAQTWEHVALLRARAIAGDVAEAAEMLDRVRDEVRRRHGPPWQELADIRQRVESERGAAAGAVPLKTGPGGTMDVDFLAGGGLLERGEIPLPKPPSVAAMLRAAGGEAAASCLEAYLLLRRAETCVRWVAGRAVEAVEPARLDATAELVEPGLSGTALTARLEDASRRVRNAYARVISAGSIGALTGP